MTEFGQDLNAVLLCLAVGAPFVFAVVLLLAERVPQALTRNLALIGFFIPLLIAGWLWGAYGAYDGAVYAFQSDFGTGLERFGISLKLGLNGISLPLFMLASIVGAAAGLYASQSDAERLRSYLVLLLIMQGGIMGVFASIDIFFFYFFHEVALIPTFVLIAVWGGRMRRAIAVEMAVYLTVGALLSLAGLLTVYVESGLTSFDMVTFRDHLATLQFSAAVEKYAFALLLFGFGILVSLWPFHTWAPRVYGAAPTPAAMLHAGILKKFGLYGLIQIALPLLPAGLALWQPWLVWLALGNVIIIGLVTLAQTDLRQMIGYSSVMHMGYAFLGIACFSVTGVGGAVFLMFGHGLSVALMLMLSTCVHHRTETFEMPDMGGLGRHAPVMAAFFVAGTMASIGLPGFANFWGELSIFVALWDFRPWVVVPAVLGIVISAVYGLRATAAVFFGEPSEAFAELQEKETPQDLAFWEKASAGILIAALLLFGLLPNGISDSINQGLHAMYPTVSPFSEPAQAGESAAVRADPESAGDTEPGVDAPPVVLPSETPPAAIETTAQRSGESLLTVAAGTGE